MQDLEKMLDDFGDSERIKKAAADEKRRQQEEKDKREQEQARRDIQQLVRPILDEFVNVLNSKKHKAEVIKQEMTNGTLSLILSFKPTVEGVNVSQVQGVMTVNARLGGGFSIAEEYPHPFKRHQGPKSNLTPFNEGELRAIATGFVQRTLKQTEKPQDLR